MVVFLANKYIAPTAWQLWQTCGGYDNFQGKKIFWSDVVLYVKKNPEKSVFFEKLIKKLCIVGRNYSDMSAPLPIIVKNLLNKSTCYDEFIWQNIIKEWTEVKLDLKLKLQAIILRKDDEIEKFVDDIAKGKKTPKQLVFKIFEESDLVKRYQKEDVILMLCSLIADKLKVDFEKKEFDEKMAEGTFQVIEEPVVEFKEPLQQKTIDLSANVDPLASLPISEDSSNQLRIILGRFIYELKAQTPLQDEWDDVKDILNEALQISDDKLKEREAIKKRRELVGGFKQKINFIVNTFSVYINNLGISLPKVEKVDDLTNEQLEISVEALNGLKEALTSYQELITKSTNNLVDEKRRISLVLNSMTDIENFVGVISTTINEEKSKAKEIQKAEVIDPMDTINNLWQTASLSEQEQSGQITLFS